MTITRSAQGARSLPRRYYVDDSHFARELDVIFSRHWIMVGRCEDWPQAGNFRTVTVAGQPLLLIRDDTGRILCFHNVCRHRGALLVNEACGLATGQRLTCPYHAWSYRFCGELASAPNMTDVEEFDPREYPLHRVATAAWQGFVFVHLTADPAESPELMGDLSPNVSAWQLESLIRGAEIKYSIRANWKLLFENYSECYHCPSVHPALNRLTPFKSATNECEDGPILGGPMMFSHDVESMSHSGRRVADYLPGLSPDQRRSVMYFTVFPTCFLSLHPDYAMVHRLMPLSADRTDVACEFFFSPNAVQRGGFDPSDATSFWDLTNRQDWDVCERVQAGAVSHAFAPGPLSNLESVVAAFDRHYLSVIHGSS